MNSEALEIFRNNLLLQLGQASNMGLAPKTLAIGAHLAGIPAGVDEVKSELQYFVDKGFAELCQKSLSPENQRYRIHANGRDYLATQGLA